MSTIPCGALLKRSNDTEGGPIRLVRSTTPRRGLVKFLWTGTEHEMNLEDPLLGRFELLSGVPVSWRSQDSTRSGEVLNRTSDPKTELWSYRISASGAEHLVEESEIEPLPVDRSDPMSVFRTTMWQSVVAASWRQSFLKTIDGWMRQTSGIPTLMGVRAEPMGHQLYAMRRVLASSRPRFILADEVGLGKTIEAGLVLQALMQAEPDLRVLVIAPGSMSRQWFSEMYLRFGARVFGLLEAEGLAREGKNARAYAQKRLDGGRVIVSSTALMASPQLRDMVGRLFWDMVILDEAHRIVEGHPLFATVETLASRSAGLLALSATPSSKEMIGLSSLLSLVAPEAYQSGLTKDLENRVSAQRSIWRALRDTIDFVDAAKRESAELGPSDLGFLAGIWESVGVDDHAIQELTANITSGSVADVEALVAYVQEFHRIDQRLIRTRRVTLSAQGKKWPIRRLETIEYEASNAELNLISHLADLGIPDDSESQQAGLRLLYERVCCLCPEHALAYLQYRRLHLNTPEFGSTAENPFERLLQDPEPGYEETLQCSVLRTTPPLNGEQRWLNTALELLKEWREGDGGTTARFRTAGDWIQAHLKQQDDNKVLVFCQEKDVVERFAKYLRSLVDAQVETFHHAKPEDELSDVARRFQANPKCRILVSDELGGEGRNFQIATVVLHLDMPWATSRVEQRIGRLDRIARPADRDVLSVVVVGPGEIERAVFETHRDVFRVFDESIGGLEFGLPAIQRQIIQAMRGGAANLRSVAEHLRRLVSAEKGRSEEAFEAALDSSKRQLAEGEALAKSLTETLAVGADNRAKALMNWARHRGLQVKPQPNGWLTIVVDPEWYRGPQGRLPYKKRVVLDATFQHRTAMKNEKLQFLGPGHPLVDFLVRDFEAESSGRASAAKVVVPPHHADRIFAFITLRCVANLDELGETRLSPAMRLRVAELYPPSRVHVKMELLPYDSPPIREIGDQEQEFVSGLPNAGSIQPITPEELNAIARLGDIWKAVERAVGDSLEQVRARRAENRNTALGRLSEGVRFDEMYYRWRISCGDTLAAIELSALEQAKAAIETEIVTLDSVLLIAGVAL